MGVFRIKFKLNTIFPPEISTKEYFSELKSKLMIIFPPRNQHERRVHGVRVGLAREKLYAVKSA